MSQVLRNVKALGAEWEGTVQTSYTGSLSPSCPALAVAPLDFKSHLHSENSKASYQ